MNIKFRHAIAVIPALIFWAVSVAFFIIGLSLDDTSGYMLYIAVALAFANTVIQLIGWDTHPSELGQLLFWSWIGSYVLGIGTNMVALIMILQIPYASLEWIVAAALSFMIEVTPERLFVLAWRSLSPKNGGYRSKSNNPFSRQNVFQGNEDRRGLQRYQGQGKKRKHNQVQNSPAGQTPHGMTRRDYLRSLEQNRGHQQKLSASQQGGGLFPPFEDFDEDDF